MNETDRLNRFVQSRDQDAFARLVERHADLVYAAAARQVGIGSQADDVTQAVFILLARKAGSIQGPSLAGWLVKTTRLAAMQAIRGERRRKTREQKAAAMKNFFTSPAPSQWDRVCPVLDEALARLGDLDRSAITLRYLAGTSIDQVAQTMGASRDATAKRLS